MFLLQASSDICMIRLDFIDGTISEPEGITPHKIIVVFDELTSSFQFH